ncbi:MAG TPA: hypothetical protein PK950_02775 [Candidatus Paceibacterota bacterium]|nr:hypothetical protein [Candidatus Paceibacterota bacterium]
MANKTEKTKMQIAKIIPIEGNKEHYNAHTGLVWCLDCRYKQAREALISHFGMDSEDLVSIAGGAMDLVRGTEEEKNYVLKNIKVAVALHNAPRILLMVHTDCGAYKLHPSNGHVEDWKGISWHDFLAPDLEKAYHVVREYLKTSGLEDKCRAFWASKNQPIDSIEIQTVIADFDGIYSVVHPSYEQVEVSLN